MIAVEGGEDLVKRFGLVWVKASPEGTGGICLIFIHLGQFCLGVSCCSPWWLSASTAEDADEVQKSPGFCCRV